jgi:hypothetical protein
LCTQISDEEHRMPARLEQKTRNIDKHCRKWNIGMAGSHAYTHGSGAVYP